MVSIRKMRHDDWEEISHIDTAAFNDFLEKHGHETRTNNRTQDNLLANMAMYPDGCFVAETDKLVGYIFSRYWGRLGWIGVFGVSPDVHGQGIGQRLLNRAIDSLDQAGCTTIGLETMADSPYNVGLYAKSGFSLTYPTLYMSSASRSITSTSLFIPLGDLKKGEAADWIAVLSHRSNSQVDYVSEALNAEAYGWGETLLFGWPQPYGFAIVRRRSVMQGSSQPLCEVICLVIEADSRNRLGEVLEVLQSYAFEKNAEQVTLAVNAIDKGALQQVLRNGFQVGSIMLRMIYRGELLHPEGIDMARWIM